MQYHYSATGKTADLAVTESASISAPCEPKPSVEHLDPEPGATALPVDGRVVLKFNHTYTTIAQLLKFMKEPSDGTPSSTKDLLLGNAGTRYGCFRTAANNCCFVRQWQLEKFGETTPLLSVRAGLEDPGATDISDEVPL